MKRVVKIGTRKSSLALTQAATVAAEIERVKPGWKCELVKIVTTGDLKQSSPESTPRDKRDWVAEIEERLLTGDVDLAVHSGKDVPVDIHSATEVLSVLRRAPACDVYYLKNRPGSEHPASGNFFELLPNGATIGTASLRRTAQLLCKRPDLNVVPLRGNVPTRLDKLAESDTIDAIVLAAAGVSRLSGIRDPDGEFSLEDLLPAVAQGTLCVQYCSQKREIAELVHLLSHAETEVTWVAEREVIRTVGAGCRSAIGCFAELSGEGLFIRSRVYSLDGSRMIEAVASGPASDAVALGKKVGHALIDRGALPLLSV